MHCLRRQGSLRKAYPVPMKGSGAVYISLSRLAGMPVIWQDRQMGYVEHALVDAGLCCLDGVVVRKGIGAAKWVGCGAIALVGSRCVLINAKPERMPVRGQDRPGQVFLTTGQSAGEVTDVFIQCDTFRVAALEVCQGPLYRLMGQRAYAPQFCVQPNGQVMVQDLLSWAQLVKQLGEEEEG